MISAAKKLLRRLACKLRGHRYDTPEFSLNTLYFCSCCGRELLDRTFDDIEPMSDEDIEQMHRMEGS
jgi:hypothetical protein